MDDLETRKVKSEIFKNYIGAIAIFVGGLWVLYNFQVLRTAYTANLDLSIKESNLVLLDFDIEVEILDSPCESKVGLQVDVLIKNKGNFPVIMYLANEKTGMGISKIAEGFDKDGHPNVKKFYSSIPYNIHFENLWMEKTTVVALPNIETKIVYFINVDEPGYYLASFFSGVASEPLNLMEKHTKGIDKGDMPTLNIWSTQKYFSVPNRNKLEQCG